MANDKQSARSDQEKGKGDKSTKSAQEASGALRTNDIVAEHGRASDDFVAAMPHNAIKALEHGYDNAVAPPTGETVTPGSTKLTASTTTEDTENKKTGGAALLERMRPLSRLIAFASVQVTSG